MKLDPRLLIQFAVIAEENSVTRAAERLHVAQPWLSARLKKLEEQIGFALFTRTTRSIQLTPKGRELLPAARSVYGATMTTEALASQLAQRNERSLRLGCPPYSDQIFRRRELLDRFVEHHPEISVELDVGWTPRLLDRVLSGSLDLAFMLGPLKNERLEAMPLHSVKVELMMADEHPLASLSALRTIDLENQTIAVFNRALHPELYDSIFLPWEQAGANLMKVAEINETLIERALSSERLVVASFSLREDYQDLPGVVRRVLHDSEPVPFSLVRLIDRTSPEGQVFWEGAVS